MKKKKLLWWGDSPTVNTGFGIVSRNLLEYLGEFYEIGVMGINEYGLKRYDTSKYFIYPMERTDMFGFNRFKYVIDDFKPDLIILFQDIWNSYSMVSKEKEIFGKIPYVLYFPIDARPFSKVWKEVLLSAAKIITYTQWAKQTVLDTFPDLRNINCVAHGINTQVFKPLPSPIISFLRESYGWKNKFIISNVNRFQPRKYVNQTLRIASLLIKGYKLCSCGNMYPSHYNTCDLNGCSSASVEREGGGHPEIALYLHMNIKEHMMGQFPSDFLTSHALNNGFTVEDMGRNLFMLGNQVYSKNEISELELNNIYNAANVMLSTSLGEGFGLTTAEALATGTPVIVGKHSANFEVTKNGEFGTLVNNEAMINWGGDNGHVRPIMDIKLAYNTILELYKANGTEKVPDTRLSAHIADNFNWKKESEKFYNIIKDV